MDELMKELQGLLEKYKDGTPEGTSAEDEQKDIARMAELTKMVETRKAEQRSERIAAARRAIESDQAKKVDEIPISASANASQMRIKVKENVDSKIARRAWAKNLASQANVQIIGGTEMTKEERAAFVHLTTNTADVVPVEVQNEIIEMIDNSSVLYNDIPKDNFKKVYEIPRHVKIKAGDAAKTNEGEAPVDEENNFDHITITGDEIKKTAKMSRKMAVQSIDGFEQWVIREVGIRTGVAANAACYARLLDTTVGMDTANQISCTKAGTLTKADLTKSFGLIKTYDVPAPKGIVIYANNTTIWNYIAMVENNNGDSYFVDEKTEDPRVQGRIFGKVVKQDDSIADGIIYIGCPDLLMGNIFDGPDVTGYVATDGTQRHCFDGYLLFDCGLAVPESFVQLTIGTASA